jgi:hypothetical protein
VFNSLPGYNFNSSEHQLAVLREAEMFFAAQALSGVIGRENTGAKAGKTSLARDYRN